MESVGGVASETADNAASKVVIITGTAGMLGSAQVERLGPHYRVVGFDRSGSTPAPTRAECVCVDVTSDESVEAGFRRVHYAYGDRIASVIHLAAYYDFSGAPSPKYEEVTVQGTERMLGALQSFHVEQFVFSSSMLVYAPSKPGERIAEESPLDPKWAYPTSKVETERAIRERHGDIPFVLLRIAGVYSDECHSIPIAHEIQRIYERQLTSHFFPGDVSQGRQSFIHIDDLTDAFQRLVDARATLPRDLTLLVGERDAMSYGELQEEIGCLLHGKDWRTYEIPESLAKAGAWVEEEIPLGGEPFIKPWMIDLADDNYELDISRARTLLDWQPRHTLRTTLPKMIASLKADPLKWYHENKLDVPGWLKEKMAPLASASMPDNRSDDSAMEPGSMGGGTDHDMGHGMGQDQRLWTSLAVVALGAWLLTSPFSFGYRSIPVFWSDVASGTLLVVFGLLSVSPQRLWAPWAACFVGIWLQVAPLVFWAPSAAAYANDTLVGVLVIGLTVLIPGMPGMMQMMQPGPETPPGWSYNPSSWLQRTPIIALGFVGWFASRYLAAYQLGYTHTMWEPFFGMGTTRVLTSDVSRAWPISDAGLGAAAYTIETLMGYMGGADRWRTMPWMVTFFGILVIPLGVVSITLVILQPVAVGTWCTLCLVTALAMLIMIPLTVDEVVAMGQFLAQTHAQGKPFWRTFWMGGTVENAEENTETGASGSAKDMYSDTRSPRFTAPLKETVPAMMWGISVPWTLSASAALGIWLMSAPALFGTQGSAANSNYLVGALVVTTAVVTMAEVIRAGRFVNVLAGLWVIAAPWFLSDASTTARWSNAIAGILIVLLSIPGGSIRERYGHWDKYIR